MEKVKLSTLSKDTVVYVEGSIDVITVAKVLEDIDNYKAKEIYTTKPHPASFDAESILDTAIENEQENGMYEDWDDAIRLDITDEDISDLQKIFDRILARNPGQNMAYESDELIEIDV